MKNTQRSLSILLLSTILLVFLLPTPTLSFSLVANANVNKNLEIRLAKLPTDLPAIQSCRRSAYAGKPVNLSAAVSFCNADQIQKPDYTCVIAVDKSTKEVLGTADLNVNTVVLNNVYVREEARKRGIAKLMMEAVEEAIEDKSKKLKLTVMSKNVPAVSLYKKLGFDAPGVYGGLDALSSVTPFNFLMEMEKSL
mmetsp:Transcript_5228/g.9601  ORF Transcript_5228/g.9601 Transcript_5228/m.9601 type:complete len:195 (-) Transcript_5228:368-952(-)|eukprot:CAMPEP_0183708828 /NCGR_PEP_ID=MMETSP0737-20130205/5021_1 /TAXON_ID=385413 /ORGANISM="Thalassiosira miniscula, Strain CCMP1093" /LENGTH=194 /DNA_ID=CAMNT_0025936777 /DNA_START=291 /DNA_END=875 /DNA_ORIENTATION=+